MQCILKACNDVFPGYQVTMFIAEPRDVAEKEGRDPRFNYASNADRSDMIGVIKAFIAKNEAMVKVDEAVAQEPPSPEAQ